MTGPSRPTGRRIRELPAAERPRERLASRGVAGLSAAELVALVWGSGAQGRSAVDLAHEALARHDGLTGLARASELELAALPGIGPARAGQLVASFELGRRLLADWPTSHWTIRTPADVADRLVLQMGHLAREELRVVLLNTRNVVQRVATVYVGNVSTSLVRIGELFRDAVRLDAAAVILVHNHPSGDPTPSPDDLHLTAEAHEDPFAFEEALVAETVTSWSVTVELPTPESSDLVEIDPGGRRGRCVAAGRRQQQEEPNCSCPLNVSTIHVSPHRFLSFLLSIAVPGTVSQFRPKSTIGV